MVTDKLNGNMSAAGSEAEAMCGAKRAERLETMFHSFSFAGRAWNISFLPPARLAFGNHLMRGPGIAARCASMDEFQRGGAGWHVHERG